MRKILATTSLALLLAACGGSGEPEKKAETPAVEIPAETPTPAESPTTASIAVGEPNPSTPETPDTSAIFAGLPAPYDTADYSKGKRLFKQCQACHRVDETGKNLVGPNLYGVINRPAASLESFNYSEAMHKAHDADGLIWTSEHLDKYIENPRAYIPGNKMSYAGLRKPNDRVDLIAYLMIESGYKPE